jgi:hypothetical protein
MGMGMKLLSKDEVHAKMVAVLRLDPSSLDLTCVEAMANALRRAASFRCPCPPRTLVEAVVGPVSHLVKDVDKTQEEVQGVLDALIAHGDLIELRTVTQAGARQRATLVYGAPPSFVRRGSGLMLLLGVVPDIILPLSEKLESRVEYFNHIRRLKGETDEDIRTILIQLGFTELSIEAWQNMPRSETPALHLARINSVLDKAGPSGEVTGLKLLDSSRPVRFYKGRWVDPKGQTGRFVGRREQAYGAPLWCFVELREGEALRLLDFPSPGSTLRGCDEAFRLQAGIDLTAGHPQQFRVTAGQMETAEMHFFAPVPMWAERRWNAIGARVSPKGSLFGFGFPTKEAAEEKRFALESLWLQEVAN